MAWARKLLCSVYYAGGRWTSCRLLPHTAHHVIWLVPVFVTITCISAELCCQRSNYYWMTRPRLTSVSVCYFSRTAICVHLCHPVNVSRPVCQSDLYKLQLNNHASNIIKDSNKSVPVHISVVEMTSAQTCYVDGINYLWKTFGKSFEICIIALLALIGMNLDIIYT